MSYYPATVDSNEIKHVGKIKRTKRDIQVEAKFEWTLPAVLPALANNYWAIRVRKCILLQDVVQIPKNEDYLIDIYFHDTKTGTITLKDTVYPADTRSVVKNRRDLVVLLNQSIPNEYRSSVYFTNEREATRLDIANGYCISLGKKLCRSIGFDPGCDYLTSGEGLPFLIRSELPVFLTGTYRSNQNEVFFDRIFKNDRLIHLQMDIVRPSLYGNRFEPILFTTTSRTAKSGEQHEGIYHDLIQTPVTSATIYLTHENGQPAYFSCDDPKDNIFSLELEFRKMMYN